VNAIYPGTPLSFTEWSAAFYQESDFSTALEMQKPMASSAARSSFATRWGAPTQGNPNYQALKLYTNYDGAHHGFGTVSVSDLNNGNPNLFSSYAALNSTGTEMTIMVLNEEPANTAQATFNLNGFSQAPILRTRCRRRPRHPSWLPVPRPGARRRNFAPYSVTLLVLTGTESTKPASEWYLNPDDIMVPPRVPQPFIRRSSAGAPM